MIPAAVRAVYSRDRYVAMAAAIEVAEDGVCVTDRYGTLRYQNAALQRLLSSEPDRSVVEQAMADAQRAVVARAGDRVRAGEGNGAVVQSTTVHAPPGIGSTPLTLQVRTPTLEYRVRGTAVRRDSGSLDEVMVVVWVRRCRPRISTPQTLRERYGLTAREVRVAGLMAARSRNREIAEALGISPHTARRHAEAVMRKLDVHARSDVLERLRE